ncbi:Zinc knuckle CX2CX4HX4C [Parasponia andersonii]|uniref:Zinc knuckle CX2CX4HX4C n=1 Tax=Parasponia andersonii TaxID=3476 RepID=A0A2P5DGW1_PARAD|nr:Zinc knuckle CX2CX4HX4C [Parasponia andersonii]
MVEVGSNCFFISLEYERLPTLCSSCKTIGHLASSCRHGQPVVAANTGEQKIERGRSRSRKRIYCPITKSPNVTKVPVTNAFFALKKDLGPKEGVEEKGKKKFWADEKAVNDEDLILPKSVNASHDDADNAKSPITKTAHLEEGLHVDAATVLPDQQNESKDSSSFEESKSDSLNTSDLSPFKVFALKDEIWQEVQSKKKKKATQALAQHSKPITRSSKTIYNESSSLELSGCLQCCNS